MVAPGAPCSPSARRVKLPPPSPRRQCRPTAAASLVKIAVVHDWLDTWRGGEKVLAEILGIYPDADLFALVDFLAPNDRLALRGKQATTSFLQYMPFSKTHFRKFLPLFPSAIESLDVSRYDLVISSSHAVAKGVRTHREQLHICYCYTPMRYAWDLRDQYLAQTGLDRGVRGVVVGRLLARLRAWDQEASARVDHFVAISLHIAQRITRCYGRDATVIYPPVSVSGSHLPREPSPVYVTVSHLVPYKRNDLLVEAFRRMPDRELIIVGDGPMRARIAAAGPPNVRLLGRLPDSERNRWLARARAFVFAAEEDFGIAPLEAQAFGTPVIAYAGGASNETIPGLASDCPAGVLFHEQTAEAIVAAIGEFERNEARIRPETCRSNAERFRPERFRRELAQFIAARQDRAPGPMTAS